MNTAALAHIDYHIITVLLYEMIVKANYVRMVQRGQRVNFALDGLLLFLGGARRDVHHLATELTLGTLALN
jgi:hypothetical protein